MALGSSLALEIPQWLIGFIVRNPVASKICARYSFAA
jgi:hypothetical protein